MSSSACTYASAYASSTNWVSCPTSNCFFLRKMLQNFPARYNIFSKDKLSTSLDSSLESWYVKSGGCNGINCNSRSSNIFDKSINEFQNYNLIGSLALPTKFNISKKTNLVFSPKLTFLPEKQIERTKSGPFYGFNSGIGLGLTHEFSRRFHTYNSIYIYNTYIIHI